jgi:dipeptidyl aminopeptidase/acylaminoacyl peptidase
MGWSYGGYASLAALAAAPDAFACGVSVVGVSHLPAQVRRYATGTPVRWHWERRVGPVEPDDAFLRARSPLHHVASIKAPLLMAHGANDATVSRVQSDVMVAALRRYDQPVTYLVLPGDGHAFYRPENRLRLFALAELFLGQALGGKVEPPSAREAWGAFLR